MRLRFQEDILASERQIARETIRKYRKDRNDIYKIDSHSRDVMTRDLIVDYYIVEMKINPDFDW
jgi:signal recognition particle GTPase